MHFRILKMIATSGFLTALECTKFDFGRGSAPDPAGGAYSVPPDFLAGLRGPTSKGGEEKERESREGKGGEEVGEEQGKRKGRGRDAREREERGGEKGRSGGGGRGGKKSKNTTLRRFRPTPLDRG